MQMSWNEHFIIMIIPYLTYKYLAKNLCSETSNPRFETFGGPLQRLYKLCPLVKTVQGTILQDKGLSIGLCKETVLGKFAIILQKYSWHKALLKLFKKFSSKQNSGCQGNLIQNKTPQNFKDVSPSKPQGQELLYMYLLFGII